MAAGRRQRSHRCNNSIRPHKVPGDSMTRTKLWCAGLAALLMCLLTESCGPTSKVDQDTEELAAFEAGKDTYIYAYPLMTMEMRDAPRSIRFPFEVGAALSTLFQFGPGLVRIESRHCLCY